MKSSLPLRPQRIVWADVLRFIAMFMVISVHCTDPFNISPAARLNPEYKFLGNNLWFDVTPLCSIVCLC